jgi:hypothetical protein
MLILTEHFSFILFAVDSFQTFHVPTSVAILITVGDL